MDMLRDSHHWAQGWGELSPRWVAMKEIVQEMD
jgi:hypothetical protein